MASSSRPWTRRVPLDLVGMAAEELGGLGEVSPPELPAAISRYRFFFNPIRYTSLPLALVEAMAVGLPVVALATTEVVTAVEHGVSGLLATDVDELIDGMRQLLVDPALARRMGREAQRRARERFSIDKFARGWLDVLASVSRVAPLPG
jgi:glycosyltransferase involved in cell wall biosynthesis